MALKFIEGFEVVPPGLLNQKWAGVDLGTTPVYATGRNGQGQCLRFIGSELTSPNLGDAITYTTGFAFNWSNLTHPLTVLEFRDGSTAQVDLRFNPTSKLFQVNRGTTVLGIGSHALSPGAWYYIELKVTTNALIGQVDLHVGGISDIALIAVNTDQSGRNLMNTISFRGNGSASYLLDDIYVLDLNGLTNNTFLGDMVVEGITPTHDGNSSDWTANSLDPNVPNPLNWQCVAALDGSRVLSKTVGDKDTYGFKNLTTITTSVAGIMTHIFGRNENSTQRVVAPVIRSGGVDYDQPTIPFPDTALRLASQINQIDPATNVAWTVESLNSAEFGMKLTT